MKLEGNNIKTLISFAVLFIIGAVLIVSIADQTAVNTQKTVVTDESFNLTSLSCYTAGGQVNESSANCALTVANNPTSWKSTECPLTSVVVTNATGTVLVLDTDYSLSASTGVVTMLNTTDTDTGSLGETPLVDYTYCGDNYVVSSWGRNVLGVNVGLFAVVLLVAAALLVYWLFGFKKEDY